LALVDPNSPVSRLFACTVNFTLQGDPRPTPQTVEPAPSLNTVMMAWFPSPLAGMIAGITWFVRPGIPGAADGMAEMPPLV